MSFQKATDYFRKYREQRERGLKNEEPIEWFMNQMSALTDVKDTFDRKDDRTSWTQTYVALVGMPDSGKTMDETMRTAERINTLARWERDVRILYLAAPDRVRSEQDRERYEYCRVSFIRKRLLRYVAIMA